MSVGDRPLQMDPFPKRVITQNLVVIGTPKFWPGTPPPLAWGVVIVSIAVSHFIKLGFTVNVSVSQKLRALISYCLFDTRNPPKTAFHKKITRHKQKQTVNIASSMSSRPKRTGAISEDRERSKRVRQRSATRSAPVLDSPGV